MNVIVVTSTELGWDCVVGVFDANKVSQKEIDECFPERPYVHSKFKVETNLNGWR